MLAAVVLALAVAEEAPRRPLAIAASVLPGALVHGAGHFAAGDRRTGWRLLAVQGVGLATMVGSVAGLAVTGASRYTVGPLAATTVAGAGLFTLSWLADVYGVSAGGTLGAAELVRPEAEIAAGVRYVHDPTLSLRALLGGSAALAWGRLLAAPEVHLSPDGEHRRTAFQLGWRFLGPGPAALPPAEDGSLLEVRAGAQERHYGPEKFDVLTVEGELAGRLELAHFAPSLAGSFADGGAGVAVAWHHYGTGEQATDVETLLLARFGFGVWLGRAPGLRSEVILSYDHRHDDDAAGSKLRGLGSGSMGHFGLTATTYAGPRWGVRVEAQAGSAYVGSVALLWRPRGGSR